MRIGIGSAPSTIDAAVADVRRAVDAGFASIWFSNIFSIDAITAAAVAGREVGGDIELGTSVVPTYPRHPHAMAQQAVTAHDATGGRFSLGIGLSHQVVIEAMLGLRYERAAQHTREYLTILRSLFENGKVSHDGELYKVHAPLDRPRGDSGPGLLVAALGPAMLAVAGELSDGTVTWMTGPKTIADHVAPKLTAAADKAGRPAPRIVCGLPVAVTEDADAMRAKASEAFAVYGGLPSYRAMLDREGAANPGDVAVLGDEDSVAAQIRALADTGVTEFNAALFGGREVQERTFSLLTSLL